MSGCSNREVFDVQQEPNVPLDGHYRFGLSSDCIDFNNRHPTNPASVVSGRAVESMQEQERNVGGELPGM
jgi:hypothetical protein